MEINDDEMIDLIENENWQIDWAEIQSGKIISSIWIQKFLIICLNYKKSEKIPASKTNLFGPN